MPQQAPLPPLSWKLFGFVGSIRIIVDVTFCSLKKEEIKKKEQTPGAPEGNEETIWGIQVSSTIPMETLPPGTPITVKMRGGSTRQSRVGRLLSSRRAYDPIAGTNRHLQRYEQAGETPEGQQTVKSQ